MIEVCTPVELANCLNIAKRREISIKTITANLLNISVVLTVLLMPFRSGIALIVGGISDRQEVRDVRVGKI